MLEKCYTLFFYSSTMVLRKKSKIVHKYTNKNDCSVSSMKKGTNTHLLK